MLTATLPAESIYDGRNYGDEKEMLSAWNVVAFRDGEYYQPITLRTYSGRSRNASRIYAGIWVTGYPHKSGFSSFGGCAGHGWAGGYGYHKASAAAHAAIRSAGITLSEPIDGRGDNAIENALSAIARAIGFEHFTIVKD